MRRVFAHAAAAVVRRPGLVLGAYLLTLLVAVPIAVLLSRVAEPALSGFAVPLDNLSAVFDVSRRPAQAIGGAAAYGFVWVFLWGPVLDAFAHGAGRRGFVRGAAEFCAPMLRLSLIALAAYAVVFLVVHPILLGWMFHALTASVESERTAFFIRFGLYAVLAAMLAAISLAIDYARVQAVVNRRRTSDALGSAMRFVRGHAPQALALAVAASAGYAILLFGYYGFDRATHGAPRLISFVVVGQAYILGRLVLRLVYAAAEVDLVIASRTADTSSGAEARSE